MAAAYSVFGLPGKPHEPSIARAINASGVVAGQVGNDAYTWDGTHVVRYPGKFFGTENAFADGTFSYQADAINRAGEAAGSGGTYNPISMSGLEYSTAMTFVRGAAGFLDVDQIGTYEVAGINDRGDLVGTDGFRGFVRLRGTPDKGIEPLSTREEFNGTRASAIDNEGRVVGGTTINVKWYREGMDDYELLQKLPIHAFLYGSDRSSMHDLGTIPGFLNTFATAINEDLTIVGYSGTSGFSKLTALYGPSHAWVWQRGHMTDLGTLHAGDSSYAFGVNDASVVAGCSGRGVVSDAAPATYRAVIWENKHIEDLNDLIPPHSGWTLRCARAINRSGWIAGEGTYDGTPRAFLLEPNR